VIQETIAEYHIKHSKLRQRLCLYVGGVPNKSRISQTKIGDILLSAIYAHNLTTSANKKLCEVTDTATNVQNVLPFQRKL